MKIPLFGLDKKKSGDKELPGQFQEEYRPDLIRRAVHVLQTAARQPYGSHPHAGKRHSSRLSKRRKNYRGCYGLGISRVNRKIHTRRGTRFFWVAAFSPQTVGGRRAHPPKSQKVWDIKINKKENQKAIRSAMAATLQRELVAHRGHYLPAEYPFIIDSKFEKLDKTKDVEAALLQLGLDKELERSAVKKVRAGIGKRRGRKYQRKKGLLIVVGEDCPLLRSAQNIPGIDIVPVKGLDAELLAPGSLPGRVTLWTEKAVDIITKENLFT
ncbi:TPA: 50S ribosomal protein L4 [Candidatus Woesearchaeota archaeon]|nr:50S ribosomal protein L4 [Candidatus Woesearchaeota archaeon]